MRVSRSAVQLMDVHRVHGLVVIDEEPAQVVGVVSQTDLLRARTSEPVWSTLKSVPVRLVMTSPAVVVSEDSDLDAAAALMKQQRVHRLVVVGPDGATPIGILSVSDLVHEMALAGA